MFRRECGVDILLLEIQHLLSAPVALYPLPNQNIPIAVRSLSIMAVDTSARHINMVSQPNFETYATYEALPLVGPKSAAGNVFTESVLEFESSRSSSSTLSSSKAVPGLYITGLGSQYPPFSFHPDRLAGVMSKWYDLETPG